ncbi:thymidine phosphorylase [Streptococcus pneumoniae]|nr:thymidine phosphorylase [Streptococcus pneumoniae]
MRAVDLIQKKRDGQELTSSEIEWLIEGYVSGTVPDYQCLPLLWLFILKE